MIHIGWQKLEESRRVNVEGTGQVVQACLQHQARLIHISTVDTLPAAVSIDQPINESAQAGVPKVPCSYVVSKREAEAVVMQAISQSGLDAVIVHPGFMLGPYDWKPSSGRMFKEVVAAPLAIAPAGGCSLCDARDVAAGIVSAIESGRTGQSYIMAGQNISYIELWQRMLRQAGKRRKVFSPIRLLNTVGRLVDWALGVLPINEGDINGAAIAMGQLGHFYDSSKAQRELNYVCRSPDETLRDAWQWLQRGV
jgi:dihydroflavonol-4-reductase